MKTAVLAEIKSLADYGRAKGVALGGYSLLASRSIDVEDDAINPATGKPGGKRLLRRLPVFGEPLGRGLFPQTATIFFETGCGVFAENDGSYPWRDVCASTHHPGHEGLADSGSGNSGGSLHRFTSGAAPQVCISTCRIGIISKAPAQMRHGLPRVQLVSAPRA